MASAKLSGKTHRAITSLDNAIALSEPRMSWVMLQ